MIRLLLLISLVWPCLGSTVIVWLTKDGIVAAADSLEVSEKDQAICKIQPLGKYFFAATGFTSMRTDSVLYDAREEAKTIAQDSANMDDFTFKFVDSMTRKLTVAMTASLRSDPRLFLSEMQGKGGALAATVFGIEDGQPKVSLISFTPTAVNPSTVRVQSSVQRCPGEAACDFTHGVFGQLGIRDFMGPKLEPNPKTLKDAVPWAESLIQAEIDGDSTRKPRRVDGPIVILTIRPEETRWAEGHQGSCPDLK